MSWHSDCFLLLCMLTPPPPASPGPQHRRSQATTKTPPPPHLLLFNTKLLSPASSAASLLRTLFASSLPTHHDLVQHLVHALLRASPAHGRRAFAFAASLTSSSLPPAHSSCSSKAARQTVSCLLSLTSTAGLPCSPRTNTSPPPFAPSPHLRPVSLFAGWYEFELHPATSSLPSTALSSHCPRNSRQRSCRHRRLAIASCHRWRWSPTSLLHLAAAH